MENGKSQPNEIWPVEKPVLNKQKYILPLHNTP